MGRIGYARISTEDQNLDMQLRALRKAGCKRIFKDTISGARVHRPGLDRALACVKRGDVLIVWKLDRLGRSMAHLLSVVRRLTRRGVGLLSLSETIDTTTAGGRLVFHVMSALAEFERALISERTKEGLLAAQQRGVQLGRHRVLSPALILRAYRCVCRGERIPDVALRLRVGRSTLYRALQRKRT